MNKILTLAGALVMTLSACATPATTVAPAPANDNPLSGLLGGLKNAGNGSQGKTSDLGAALGGLVGGLLGNQKVDAASMVGTWSYAGPAVCFKSENFLQKAGGSAIAGTIESKLAPYYERFGLNKIQLTIDRQQQFTMAVGKMQVGGTVEIEGDDVYFNFQALGKVKLGKIKTYVTQTGNTMSVMFDITKLVNIIKAVGSATGNSAISTVTKLLDSYEGICAGFKLTK